MEKKIVIEFKVVSGYGSNAVAAAGALETEVNQLLSQGWSLYGNSIVCNGTLLQPMVRTERIDKSELI